MSRKYDGLEIAIIGMSGQFPGSKDYREFWENLLAGKESLRTFTEEELKGYGVPEEELQNELYVKSGMVLEDKDRFDAGFFGYSPEEAALMDPQIRIFHEHCWKALEDAGYSSGIEDLKIALFAGASKNYNWKAYVYSQQGNAKVDPFYLNLISSPNFISTLISYKLNLRGGSFYIDTACSTSLVAISQACRNLLTRECKIALAGGVAINTSKRKGYIYQEGMIDSADGHCRAFDEDASGAVGGEGAGVVVLKRLSDAMKDGDHIYAIIKSTSVNNDGNQKVGYTAPSVNGQLDCIRMAHKLAGVDPRSIGYVEAHGTGTRLGDPVEIRALNEAFGTGGSDKFCALGSVKTNIGHLDTAAGVAGLMKAALSLYYRKLPASLHYRSANPAIDFAGGPFYVNGSLQSWEGRDGSPLRAGVSSFGIGGTNAHAVLEEAPMVESGSAGRGYQLLVLSARTEGSLVRYGEALKEFIRKEEPLNMADLSYTLQAGRRGFSFRKSVAYRDRGELLSWLEAGKYREGISRAGEKRPGVVLLLPGQGVQYGGMCRELYGGEPVFRSVLEEGFEILRALTGEDFSEVLYPVTETDLRIHDTKYTQPCLFLVEYGLARLLESYGIRAEYMLGHSLGEYVAACLGGLWSFADGLRLVWRRGQLMSGLSPGGMVSVRLGEAAASGYLSEGLSLAAVNGSEQCVLSGDAGSVERLVSRLEEDGVGYIKLMTSHAFHSQMQEGILESFGEELSRVRWGKLEGKVLSNVTGKLLESGEAGRAEYWVGHLRGTVRFYEGLQTLLSLDKELIYIEAGPGHSLGGLLRQAGAVGGSRKGGHPSLPGASAGSISLVRSARESVSDGHQLAGALGRLWEQGVVIDWGAYHRGEVRHRVSLPTYCFEATRYVAEVDPLSGGLSGVGRQLSGSRGESLGDWVYHPVWKSVAVRGPVGGSLADASGQEPRGYLFFAAPGGMTERVVSVLRERGQVVVVVWAGEEYVRRGVDEYELDPGSREQVDRLLGELHEGRIIITDIVYNWGGGSLSLGTGWGRENRSLRLCFFGLLRVVQGLLDRGGLSGKGLVLLTDRLHKVVGNEQSGPVQSLGLGLLRVLSQEQEVGYRHIDADGTEGDAGGVVAEELLRGGEREVSLRHGRRWVREYVRNREVVEAGEGGIVQGGVYVITGGLGKVGSMLGRHLLGKYGVKLVVLGRRSEESLAGAGQEESLERSEGVGSSGEAARRWRELQRLGGSVYYYCADIMDRSGLMAVVEAVEERLGRINGVIHAAGNVEKGDFSWCAEMSEEKALSVMGAKVAGLENLYGVFGPRRPDFVWLTSSLSAVVGGLSYGSYAAANIYMDQFVESLPGEAGNWKSVGLSEMQLTEEGGSRERAEHRQALRPEEVFVLLEWSVRLKGPGVLYETIAPLTERISRAYERKDAILEEESGEGASVGSLLAKRLAVRRERPSLSTSYEGPENRTEEILVEMLQDFFGIDKIGVTDSFFELGGDSLKAMVLLKKICQEFRINMTVKDFFERQNIRQLAVEIEDKVWMTGGGGEKKFVSII